MDEINIKNELNKCMNCINKPCQKGCPLNNDIPAIIDLMKQNEYKEAYKLLCNTTVLSSICGRICPHSRQCQGNCTGRFKNNTVHIGNIEAYLGDMAIENNWEIPKFTDVKNEKKIAVVGGGPAGLTCAVFLVRNGFDVTIYEKHSSLGGTIAHGIPKFRLDRDIINSTIDKILELGINVEYNKELGKNIDLREIEETYDAIFLSFGKNISSKMNIEGENLQQVLGANELLEYDNYPDFKEKKVAVIGGGNVAMDVSRTIKRLGAKLVTVIYRRSKDEMPAEEKEIKDAENEGISFLYQTNLIKIVGNESVEKIECIKTELIEKDGETRKTPIDIEGSNFTIDVDYVIMAIGSQTNKDLIKLLGMDNSQKILVNEQYRIPDRKIFVGGDLVNNKGTVAWACKTGRDAANEIIKYLQ